jgi:death-on-curing protein
MLTRLPWICQRPTPSTSLQMSWRWIDKQGCCCTAKAWPNMAVARACATKVCWSVGRPLNLLAYGEPDVAALAASYASSPICRWQQARRLFDMFLYLNGYRLSTTQADATVTVLALAAGDITEEQFAAWLRKTVLTRSGKKL